MLPNRMDLIEITIPPQPDIENVSLVNNGGPREFMGLKIIMIESVSKALHWSLLIVHYLK